MGSEWTAKRMGMPELRLFGLPVLHVKKLHSLSKMWSKVKSRGKQMPYIEDYYE